MNGTVEQFSFRHLVQSKNSNNEYASNIEIQNHENQKSCINYILFKCFDL